jgi:hypothetical protein
MYINCLHLKKSKEGDVTTRGANSRTVKKNTAEMKEGDVGMNGMWEMKFVRDEGSKRLLYPRG